jgi:hypothetical protein
LVGNFVPQGYSSNRSSERCVVHGKLLQALQVNCDDAVIGQHLQLRLKPTYISSLDMPLLLKLCDHFSPEPYTQDVHYSHNFVGREWECNCYQCGGSSNCSGAGGFVLGDIYHLGFMSSNLLPVLVFSVQYSIESIVYNGQCCYSLSIIKRRFLSQFILDTP